MGIAHFIRAQAYWGHPLDEKLSPQMRSLCLGGCRAL